ncbi:hypothetical protein AURDEDRAFT_175674 [Auricularia subglabra TFB-10046 SS5]|uniref:Plant expansin n=1 Tax=Auricularia subglabra (strain TFB-10046 / SS5) TaxID=717982 RepID=J0WRC7_AURST|nr:hypothetical protein AURDEDRAFT_175674 [Auricularia subglabra TFB-10046 SS5]
MLSLPLILTAALLSGLAAANPVAPRQIGPQSGDGTYFDTSVGLGACGVQNNNNQYIAAVSHALFDSFPGYGGGNPNNNPICGRSATAHYGGRSITFTIEDRCAGCAGYGDVDFTPAAFTALVGSLGPGRVHGVTWSLN